MGEIASQRWSALAYEYRNADLKLQINSWITSGLVRLVALRCCLRDSIFEVGTGVFITFDAVRAKSGHFVIGDELRYGSTIVSGSEQSRSSDLRR